MSPLNSPNLTIQEAQEVLKPFNCLESQPAISESEKARIRQALLLLSEHSDYQILGICADTTAQGVSALATYAEALGYQPNFDLTPIDGSVYIKFNPNTGLCYIDSYTGDHRGVLVSCQSSFEGGINEMYGHLPLNLFKSS
ncbi:MULTISPECIES: DUF1824 family protein [unclassified Coleofasciculus]|uniref:DUF1824 family protein n=1 Tax=unclassified Coleofasciculus TaxID=2692782 RepID=UPI00187EC85B|nr:MULTISPECIES: DUF1824 family protein [unclassified Coleofasciculus]MBE9126330.1 DUF1824 family protein [Coleofasciculus sp. LEGE 07081]MBE9147493.1 DUF1824 family protein [Coleofasciculus sp. LEGE 07092]